VLRIVAGPYAVEASTFGAPPWPLEAGATAPPAAVSAPFAAAAEGDEAALLASIGPEAGFIAAAEAVVEPSELADNDGADDCVSTAGEAPVVDWADGLGIGIDPLTAFCLTFPEPAGMTGCEPPDIGPLAELGFVSPEPVSANSAEGCGEEPAVFDPATDCGVVIIDPVDNEGACDCAFATGELIGIGELPTENNGAINEEAEELPLIVPAGGVGSAGIGVPEIPDWMAEGEEDAILLSACRRVASGATHFVQIVDVEVLKIVDRTVFTCSVGLPPAGVTVLVTGQDVTVVWILEVMLVTDR